MTNFFTPVQIQRAVFELLILRVDEAVGRHAVALALNEDVPLRELDPVSPTAIDLTGIALDEDPLEIVNYLDQLLYFAFEGATDEIISSWASDYDKELSKEAVDRVKFMRANMSKLTSLWNAKNNSIIPPLVSFGFDFTDTPGAGRQAQLYLAAARITLSGRPDKTDMSRMRVQLWPSDVRVLVRELEHLWHAHLIGSERGEAGGESDDESNDSSS